MSDYGFIRRKAKRAALKHVAEFVRQDDQVQRFFEAVDLAITTYNIEIGGATEARLPDETAPAYGSYPLGIARFDNFDERLRQVEQKLATFDDVLAGINRSLLDYDTLLAQQFHPSETSLPPSEVWLPHDDEAGALTPAAGWPDWKRGDNLHIMHTDIPPGWYTFTGARDRINGSLDRVQVRWIDGNSTLRLHFVPAYCVTQHIKNEETTDAYAAR